MHRLIETEEDIARGLDWLVRVEPRFGVALALTGPPPLRRRPGGFAGVLRIVCAQQVSVAVAEGLWRRLVEAGADRPERIDAMSDAELRACGLSGAKVRYARALAGAQIDFDALAGIDDEGVVERLTAVPGIGRWTAQIYLMVCLGRSDVFASGDLALREGVRLLFGLDDRPPPQGLDAMAAAWAPWRAVAARQIWAYYAAARRHEGVI